MDEQSYTPDRGDVEALVAGPWPLHEDAAERILVTLHDERGWRDRGEATAGRDPEILRQAAQSVVTGQMRDIAAELDAAKALLDRVRGIVAEPLDERPGQGPNRNAQFLRIEQALRHPPTDGDSQIDRLKAVRDKVPFLLSVIASGERLSDAEQEEIRVLYARA